MAITGREGGRRKWIENTVKYMIYLCEVDFM